MLQLPPAAHTSWALAWTAFLLVMSLGGIANSRAAQPLPASPPRFAEVRGTQRALLGRLIVSMDERQHADALELITRLLQSDLQRVVRVGEGHYIGLSDYCQRVLASLPSEVLTQYRQRVDATAAQWYRQAIADRDQQRLQRLVDEMFCSSWGDEALLALGELALQRGEYQTARTAWQRIMLEYPDTNLDPAMVDARLVLLSIREGDYAEAKAQLAASQKNHPKARGRLAGRDVKLTEYLATLLAQLNDRLENDSKAVARTYRKLWSLPLATDTVSKKYQPATRPIVVGKLLAYQDSAGIHTVHLATGTPALADNGVVLPAKRLATGVADTRPWYRLAATNRYVFGTVSSLSRRRGSTSALKADSLWGIDLARDGALFFQQTPQNGEATFAGPPTIDGLRLLVPLSTSGRSTGVSVACYDMARGGLLWQRLICQVDAANPHSAMEISIDSGIAYLNTNLGVVAALRASDGRVLWLRTYPRQVVPVGGDQPSRSHHTTNPILYYHGKLLVEPTGSTEIFALNAATGSRLWSTKKRTPTACVFAQTNNTLLIGSQLLQAIDVQTGRPDPAWESLGSNGRGQGVLDGRAFLWPTDHAIELLDARTGQLIAPPIELSQPGGANLLIAGNYLIAAGPTELTVFTTVQKKQPTTTTDAAHETSSNNTSLNNLAE